MSSEIDLRQHRGKGAPVRPNRQRVDTFPGDPDPSAPGRGRRFCIPNQLQVVEGPLEAGVHPKAQNEPGFALGKARSQQRWGH